MLRKGLGVTSQLTMSVKNSNGNIALAKLQVRFVVTDTKRNLRGGI